MSFSVLTNLSSMAAADQAGINPTSLQKTFNRLSSGSRLQAGGDDPAGLGVVVALKGQIGSLSQSVRNANDGIGLAQTADSALGQIGNLLNRAASLLSQAANDTNSGSLSSINTELGEIYKEINRVGAGTNFNGISVFSASARSIFVGDTTNATVSSQATISFTVGALTASGLGLTTNVTGSQQSVAVGVSTNAASMLSEVKTAIDSVATSRGSLGASMNRLQNAVGVMQSQVQNLTAAQSQISDTNVAEEVSNMTKYQILSQTSMAVMAQANSAAQQVLALLR